MASIGDNTQDGGKGTPPPKEDDGLVTGQGGPRGLNRGKSQNHSSNALGSYCTVKLNHENYVLWKSMDMLVI